MATSSGSTPSIYKVFLLLHRLLKVFGLNHYSLIINEHGTRIHITPFHIFTFFAAIFLNISMIGVHIQTWVKMDHGTILHYGVLFSLLMAHSISTITIILVYFNRLKSWKILDNLNKIDIEVGANDKLYLWYILL